MASQRRKSGLRHRLQFREAVTSASVTILCINMLILWGTLFPQLFSISIHSSSGYIVIGIIETVVLLVVIYLSIKRAHSIAGPVYAISRDLARLADGDLLVQVKLRKGDEFAEEAALINAATLSLKNRAQHLKQLFAAMQKAEDAQELQRLSVEIEVALAALRTERPEAAATQPTGEGH